RKGSLLMRPLVPPCAILCGTLALGCATGDVWDSPLLDDGTDGGGSADDASLDQARDRALSDHASVDHASPADPDAAGDLDSDLPESDAGSGDSAMVGDAATPDSSDAGASTTNIAPEGTGWTWQSMTSSSANSGKTAVPAVND